MVQSVTILVVSVVPVLQYTLLAGLYPCGSTSSRKYTLLAVHRIFDLTAIDFCPDTAHLAAAGGDPAQLIRELSDRISYIHLKGLQRDPFAFTPLDRGDVSTDVIINAMRETNYAGWVCTELDAWDKPLEGARASIDYLKQA